MSCGSDPPTMAATVKVGHLARQAGRIPKQFGRIPPARPDERDAGNCAGIQSRDARNRFALTEYREVMVSRRRVVHLDVAGRFALVLRGSLLLARLLRLVWLLRVRGIRSGYRCCADRCRDGCGT
jgi:hypothetical protein